jgi:glycosyltransferase involved in cell wall biosynthesis
VTKTVSSGLSCDELVVHAAAQLPDGVAVTTAPIRLEPHSRLTAEAYGVGDRLPIGKGPDSRGEASFAGGRTFAVLVNDLLQGRIDPSPLSASPAVLKGERVLVLSKTATHYRIPLFNELNRSIRAAEAEFRAVFLTEPTNERWWMDKGAADFEHGFLVPRRLLRTTGGAISTRGFAEQVEAFAPTIILSGGFSPAISGRAARYAARRDVPFGIWSGEISSRPTARSRARSLLRRRILSSASFAVAYGSRSAGYLRTMRHDLPLVIGRNTAPFPTSLAVQRDNERPRLLVVSRAVRGKGLEVLIQALRSVPYELELTIIGDGPESNALRELATGDRRISFAGALPSSEVLEAYRNADIFLFPSQVDVFGLVLVEAMAAGLACIVSNAPGAVGDLCVDGQNAEIVTKHDPIEWAAAIARAIEDPERSASLGRAAAVTVRQRWKMEHSVDAMIAGLRLGVMATR